MITRASKADPLFVNNVEQFRADYDAMKSSLHVRSRVGLATGGGGADWHIRNETRYFQLVEQARDLVRNDTVIGKTIERSALNITGDGFIPSPDTGDKGLDAALFDYWTDWANNPDLCDAQCEHTFLEQIQLVKQSILTDGDIVTIGRDNGSLEAIEGHLVRNPVGYRKTSPGCVIGVEIDSNRKRVRYHVRQESTDPMRLSYTRKSTPIDVRDKNGLRQVFHAWNPQRFTATRGITALAPVFYIASMFEDLNFAKLVQAKVVSMFALWRRREKDYVGGGLPIGPVAYGAQETETDTDGSEKLIESLEPGQEIPTEAGETIEAWSPNTPNPEYFDHAKLLLTMIGINLGQPFVMMFMDASESNFTGWRAAVDEARRGFKRNQRSLISRHLSPIWRWRTAWLIANAKDPALRTAAAKSGVRVDRHTFRPPAWPYVSPTEDAAAQLLRVRNGLSSPRRIHGEISQDWEEIAVETIEDNAFAIEKAILRADLINQQHGAGTVHWRELLALPTPDGVSVSITGASTSAQPNGGANARAIARRS